MPPFGGGLFQRLLLHHPPVSRRNARPIASSSSAFSSTGPAFPPRTDILYEYYSHERHRQRHGRRRRVASPSYLSSRARLCVVPFRQQRGPLRRQVSRATQNWPRRRRRRHRRKRRQGRSPRVSGHGQASLSACARRPVRCMRPGGASAFNKSAPIFVGAGRGAAMSSLSHQYW